MPSNVRRICGSVILATAGFTSVGLAQTVAQSPQPEMGIPAPAPTSGDVMRSRISKAKAYIVVRNYNAAIYELENIRKESADTAVQSVVTVLLMNSYLEQGDYKRAQDMLNGYYAALKTTKPNAAASYAAVAGQVIKGARTRAERYKSLGLNIADRTLPLEALNDLEKMRETLELVITQAKEVSKSAVKPADTMALLEEAVNSRTMIARDDYDAKHWKDEVADTREEMVNSSSVVLNALDGKPEPKVVTQAQTEQVAAAIPSAVNPPVMQPVANTPNSNSTREREVQSAPANNAPTSSDKMVVVPSAPPTVAKEEPKAAEPAKTDSAVSGDTMDVGPLVAYATRQQQPVYPNAARAMRTTGVVKVEVTVNESGDVTDVQKTSGPTLLQSAAKDAVKKWKFKPFTRDGQAVKATGYVNFNFNL